MMTRRIVWPIIIIASCVALWVLVLIGTSNPLRTALTIWVFFVCPGMAYIQLMQIKSQLEQWALALALSIIIDTLTGLVILYAGVWSYQLGLAIISAITLIGAGLYLYRLWVSTHTSMPALSEEG